MLKIEVKAQVTIGDSYHWNRKPTMQSAKFVPQMKNVRLHYDVNNIETEKQMKTNENRNIYQWGSFHELGAR